MAQFHLYTVTSQLSLALLGFFFLYIFLTKYFLVQIKRQEYLLNSIVTYKVSSDNFLIIKNFIKTFSLCILTKTNAKFAFGLLIAIYLYRFKKYTNCNIITIIKI